MRHLLGECHIIDAGEIVEHPALAPTSTWIAVWTGAVILSYGAAFDPATNNCFALPTAPRRGTLATNGREFFAYAWAGDRYLAWSGGTGSDRVDDENDGVVFVPDGP